MVVEEWSKRNGLLLGVSKCAIITTRVNLQPLFIYNQEVVYANSYTFLGFPMIKDGVNFPEHIEQRIKAAVKLYSDEWGPAHRLRIYKQYLAPISEHGAPLTCAWIRQTPQNLELFNRLTLSFKSIMSWIAGSDSRAAIIANICGLTPLVQRFQRLTTVFQWILEGVSPKNPLKQFLKQYRTIHSFGYHLGHDSDYEQFKQSSLLQPSV